MNSFAFSQIIPVLPELFLAIAGMVLLVAGAFRGNAAAGFISWGTVGCFLIAALLLVGLDWTRIEVLNGLFVMDPFAGFMKLMVLAGLSVAVALSVHSLQQESALRFEYPILILFAGIGMLMMVSAHDLLSLYVGLELQSLSLYVLAAFRRDNVRSSEAGIKYFVLGAIASGMLLFGASLVYGFTGSTNFADIAGALTDPAPMGAVIGMVFVLAGLAFKISAVPFHMWTPDVYEGAPTPVTAFFALVPKVAALALLIRVLLEPFGAVQEQWAMILWFLAAGSMAVGAFAAITQENIKRLMAYSSIGNMGYALIGLTAGSEAGVTAVIVYLAIYMVMTAGTFGVILCMRRDGLAVENIRDLAGLSRTSPLLAYALAIMMFSMSGIPPMAGFFGKFLVFQSAVAAEFYVLAVLGVLASVVAAYYYLRIIKVMFFDDPVEAFDNNIGPARKAVIILSVAAVLGFILVPNALIDAARAAASGLFAG